MEEIDKYDDARIDELEVAMMASGNLIDCPLDHVFTKSLYTRTIFVPADTLITSMIHKEEHQYIVSMGSALVKTGEDEWQEVWAHFKGITKPGTRRIFYTKEGCIWTTVHVTNVYPKDDSKEAFLEAIELVEDQIFEKRENPLLGGILKNNIITKTIRSCQV